MSLKAIDHTEKKGRLIITLQRSFLFGLIKLKPFQCIDTNRVFSNYGISVWEYYPSFKTVDVFSPKNKVLTEYKKRIEFEKK